MGDKQLDHEPLQAFQLFQVFQVFQVFQAFKTLLFFFFSRFVYVEHSSLPRTINRLQRVKENRRKENNSRKRKNPANACRTKKDGRTHTPA